MLARSSTELVRQKNSALVLAALRRHGRLAHTELSDHTGLSSATISAITADLERAFIIEKTEQQAATGRGRPRVLFEQRRDCGYLIVVVISSDAIQYSLVDYAGKLIDRFAANRELDDVTVFTNSIREGLERVVERSKIDRDSVLVISISSKGLVDPTAPTLLWSPVFGDDRIDFAAELGAGWRARIVLSNETLLVAGALGTQRHGSPAGDSGALAALSLGHSIGLGIARDVADGEMQVTAPNFGHMLHVPNGALCRCGSRGCVEAYAGFYAILRAAFEVPPDTIPAKFVPLAEVDKIAAGARQGNRMAGFAFRQAGIALGNGLSRLFSLHGHMPVFVTGPGARYYDLLLPGLEEGLAQSQTVRISGMPQLSLEPDEQKLVFDGHLSLALARMDQHILASVP